MLRPLILAALLHPAHCLGADDDHDPPLDDSGESEGGATSDGEASSGEAATWRSLVDHDAWQDELVAADDPWAEHRPAEVQCAGGWAQETGGIEVDTGACNYLLLQQPIPFAIEEGDPVRLRMWWQTLASLEPATGHVAVLIDGELLWDEEVPIPGPADVRSLEFPSPRSAPAGATLTLHLHNHGTNTWHFHDLTVLSAS